MSKVTVEREPAIAPIKSVTVTMTLDEAQCVCDLLGALKATTKPTETYMLYSALREAAPELEHMKTLFSVSRAFERSTTNDPIEGGPIKCAAPGCVGHKSGQGLHVGYAKVGV